jgi:hypothetical protein
MRGRASSPHRAYGGCVDGVPLLCGWGWLAKVIVDIPVLGLDPSIPHYSVHYRLVG